MIGDSININDLCCNPVVLKKSWQNLYKFVFGVQFVQKSGHYGPRPKWKSIFLVETTKADHQLSETFYFIKISYVLTELWIFFYLSDVFVKKLSFPAKTAATLLVQSNNRNIRKRCEIWHWRRSGISVVNFKQIL